MDRREFLKTAQGLLATVFGSSFISIEELDAMETSENKPDLIWIHAMSCDGCSTAFLNAEVPLVDILSRFVNIVFHPTIMASDGKLSMEILKKYENSENELILVVEGAIPSKEMPHVCMMGEEFIRDTIIKVARNASLAIAAGTCATFLGICDMKGMHTNAVSLHKCFEEEGIETPLINLPTCPMKPNHLLYTVFYYMKHQKLPPLDLTHRPLRFFGNTVHERCIYYNDYQEKIFAKKIGDRGCLFKLGCQGPVTKCDCIKSSNDYDKYNCIKSGHPCVGCASENFPRNILFKRHDDERSLVKYKDFKRI
jgi:hydrogenase small subunit